ncbi:MULTISPECIES: hypothetical protein [Amycolatopsis]|uniref:hypothetical protein n=1 Tax=Amycolatopsis TaxID=1813 RepID=UPI0013042E60|nr:MULTISPECIES: hypothetical protein [Amycolatopsis]
MSGNATWTYPVRRRTVEPGGVPMFTVWLSLLAETVVVTAVAAALARWSSRSRP